MYRLATTRQFSDFTFKVEGGEEHKIYKVVLTAQTRVFEKFFGEHERVHITTTGPNQCSQSHRKSTCSIFSHATRRICPQPMISTPRLRFDRSYSMSLAIATSAITTTSSTSTTRTLEYAFCVMFSSMVSLSTLKMPGLIDTSKKMFVSAFVCYSESCSAEELAAALRRCFIPDMASEFGNEQPTKLVQEVGLEVFRGAMAAYKKHGQFKEALDLMEAVLMAAASLYSQASTQEENEADEEGIEEDEIEDEDEEESKQNKEFREIQKEEYAIE
jgi:hypothetical protein